MILSILFIISDLQGESVKAETINTKISVLEQHAGIWKDWDFEEAFFSWAINMASALLWKLDTVDSETFFSHDCGYNMKLTAYPNGKGSHVSLALAILCGPHDKQLMWPYKCRTIVSIIGPDGRRCVTHTITPATDGYNENWKKPATYANKAYKLQQLLPLQRIHEYLTQDKLRVELHIIDGGK